MSAVSAANRRLNVFYRPYDPTRVTAGQTFQVTSSSSNVLLARIAAFRTDTAGKVVYFGDGGTAFSATGGSDIGPIARVTTNVPEVGAIVFFGAKIDDWTSVATLSGDNLTWTELFDDSTTLGSDAGFVADFAPWTSTPTLTNKTFTVTGGAAADTCGRSFLLTEVPADTVYRRERSGCLSYTLTRRVSRPIAVPLITAAS